MFQVLTAFERYNDPTVNTAFDKFGPGRMRYGHEYLLRLYNRVPLNGKKLEDYGTVSFRVRE